MEARVHSLSTRPDTGCQCLDSVPWDHVSTFAVSVERVQLVIGSGQVLDMPKPTARISHPYGVAFEKCEDLPFRVRIANPHEDLDRILELRSRAYGRHLPEMAKRLEQAEPDDLRDDALLLIAESKSTGHLLGSIRLVTNVARALSIEHETKLPEPFRNRYLLEARRLTVCNGPEGRMTTPALIKAIYEVSFHCGMDIVLITARHPVDRMYRAMQFQDALDGKELLLPDVNNVPHKLYFMEVATADSTWRAVNWPFYPFLAKIWHPDIGIDFEMAYQHLCQTDVETHRAV